MAIYHCSVKTVSRSSGRSATAAAAYRCAERIVDERTGEIHDYRRRGGVIHTATLAPAGERVPTRAELWNQAEAAERRKNSVVAREVVLALPAELDGRRRQDLALAFARHLADRYRVAVDVALHRPDQAGDQRNHHAHLMMTTRRLEAGQLTEKTRELDDQKTGEVMHIRQAWANACNAALEAARLPDRVDHRSNRARGIEAPPTVHLGPTITEMERRGVRTDRGDINRRALRIKELIQKLLEMKAALQKRLAAIPKRQPMAPAGIAQGFALVSPFARRPGPPESIKPEEPEPDPDPGSNFSP